MPCRDWEGISDSDYQHSKEMAKAKERLDKFAKMLCEACELLDGSVTKVVWPNDLRSWWDKHQAADQRRKDAAEQRKKNTIERKRKVHATKISEAIALLKEEGMIK